MAKKVRHSEYIRSKDWLIKKSQLVVKYLDLGWEINCVYCGSESNLHVHHTNYKRLGEEFLEDERIWDLIFLCADCHRRHHKEPGFKEGMELELINSVFGGLQ